jgi:hypothetical protein
MNSFNGFYSDIVKQIAGVDTSESLQGHTEDVKIIKTFWDNKIVVNKRNINLETENLIQKKLKELNLKYDLQGEILRKKFIKKFTDYKLKLYKKDKTRLVSLMNSGNNSFMTSNLMISILSNKMVILKITHPLSSFLPPLVTEHILGYLSLSFVWSSFFEKIGPKLAKTIRSIFRNNNFSNITISGLHPMQFYNILSIDETILKLHLKSIRLPTIRWSSIPINQILV